MAMKIGILTVSDSAAEGTAEDRSGPALVELVGGAWPQVEIITAMVADERQLIAEVLQEWADVEDVALILTTGGTGFAPRDVTPEATQAVIERAAPGIAEAIRAAGLAVTPHAMLSRGVAGMRGRTLIVNLSGSPKAVREQFAVIAPVLSHALELLRPDDGGIQHARSGEHQRKE
ncbi:MAG: MogA/MoaB family molybdenum cofactor biosynthesis protein [Caldilineales bacterium]|nr:MogA/MoaB family molybdenum cofactor biosynthesis protein [Caldilineales bacterium]